LKQVLTQQEIDSLLSALNSGELDPDALKEEEEKNKVRTYDFRRPIKLSKEYINTLYMIFENFSKLAGNLMSTQVRTNVSMKIGAVEQISFDEFIRSTPNPTLMGVFRSKPLSGIQLLEINPNFCEQIVELMCGGFESDYSKRIRKKDKFTDIELSILEELLLSILKSYEAAWSEIIEIDTSIDLIETNPQMIQSLSPNEPVILASFTMEIFKEKSFINLCIPYISIENIMDKLSLKNWFDFEKESVEENKEIISERLMSSDVNLEVSLGKSSITVNDFLQLEKGDILQLDMDINAPLRMYVEDKLHFLVKPGVYNDRLAVEVLQYIEGDVENE
jgi:flagellar motor switch protein FliM